MSYVTTDAFLAAGITFSILGVAAVGTRLRVRSQKASVGLDDYCCIAGLVLILGECGIFIAGAVTGVGGGHSPPHLGPKLLTYLDDNQVLLEKFETAFDLIQPWALLCLKLTVLFFYLRLFKSSRTFRVTAWILIGFSVAWAITFFIAIFTACGSKFYVNFRTIGELKEECVNTFAILISLAVFDVFVDLWILFMPIPLIWSLQMPVRRKIAVTLTMIVGALAIACGITRMAIFAQILGPALLSTATVGGDPSDDDMGVVSVLMFWGMLEMGVGIVAVCLPTLRPLFQGMSPETILRSLRSRLSLSSLSSNSSQRTGSTDECAKASEASESNRTLSQPEPTLGSNTGAKLESYAAHSGEDLRKTRGENNRVWVDRTVRQTVDHV